MTSTGAVVEVAIPKDDLPSVKEYGYQLWMRWYSRIPDNVPLKYARQSWIPMTCLTELNAANCGSTGMYSRNLATWSTLWNLHKRNSIHITTYNTRTKNGN